MSAIVRGLALNSELETLKEISRKLLLNIKHPVSKGNEVHWEYDNGIILKPLPEKTPGINMNLVIKYMDKENVEILENQSDSNLLLIETIANLFEIDLGLYRNNRIFSLTKRDGGFSQFEKMGINIDNDSKIVLINRSIIPSGYKYFNLAEDYTNRNIPWIQLYHFDPSMAMQVSPAVFQQLSLPPAEELIYRDESLDETEIADLSPTKLKRKITTQIHVFVFSK
jgi:hypothetical protein